MFVSAKLWAIAYLRKDEFVERTCDKPHYENEDFAIPNSWTMAEMSDLFLLNPKNEVDDETEVGFVPMACVEDGFSGNHSFETRKWEDVKKGYCHFQNGDIGVAKISPCFENLKSCILHSLPNGVGTGTTELVILRSLGVYVPFYMYLFKSSWYISQGTKYFKGVVGQQRVNKAIFTDLKVPLPSVAEQKRIVAEIKRWFAFIDIIEHEKSDLQESIKQAESKILDLAIHGKLVPQDPTDEPAYELLKRINPKAEITCDNPHYRKLPFQIPSTWAWCSHNDVLEISGGSQPAKRFFSSVPQKGYVRLYQIRDYGENPIPVYIPIEYAMKQTEEGDILLARYGGSLGKVFHAKKGAYNVAMAKVIFKDKDLINKEYAYFYYLSDLYQGRLKEISRTAQAGFNSSDFNEMYFPLPPYEEQQRIVNAINKAFTTLDVITENL